jgi:hypothetical protein
MATTDNSIDGRTEHCDSCDTSTIHQVSVQLVTESTKKENSQFSREPYRVTECQQCGSRESMRMNNA